MSALQDAQSAIARYCEVLGHNARDPRCIEQPVGRIRRWLKRRAQRHVCYFCERHIDGRRPADWPDQAPLHLDREMMRDLYVEIRVRLGGTDWMQGTHEFDAWMVRIEEEAIKKAAGPIPLHAEPDLDHVLHAFVVYSTYRRGGRTHTYSDEFNRIIRSRDRRHTLHLAASLRSALEDDPTLDPAALLETFAQGELVTSGDIGLGRGAAVKEQVLRDLGGNTDQGLIR